MNLEASHGDSIIEAGREWTEIPRNEGRESWLPELKNPIPISD